MQVHLSNTESITLREENELMNCHNELDYTNIFLHELY